MLRNKQASVLGFVFDNKLTQVALIRKARPQWQAGKLASMAVDFLKEKSAMTFTIYK